jgi:NAD+ synthase
LRPDEDAYGVTYEQIDDFLEGQGVEETALQRIQQAYASTAHKRALPATPFIITLTGDPSKPEAF